MADFAIEAKAQDVNFIAKFDTDLHNLLQVLGQEQVQIMAPGSAYKIYRSKGTTSSGTVAEKALIPDSGLSMDSEVLELTYQKYRNLTSIEAVGKQGYDVAVGGTNAALLKDVQKGIRKSIYTAIATGTGKATGKDFQTKVAAAAAAVEIAFEDEAATMIMFANPNDAYTYLGSHTVTLEQNFGLSYLANFMGIGNVVIDSNVPAGTVYGTAAENLAIAAPFITDIPGMDLTTDESGIIGVHNGALYQNAALETVAYCGLAVEPVFTDRIIVVTTAA